MKHVLVTGAAGFIGFHLAQHLAQRGDKVFGLDNFNDYYSVALKRSREDILREKGLGITEGDINDFDLIAELIEKHEITHICHLAAQAGVRYSIQNPHAYVKSNLDGFVNILELCRAYPGIKLTYASSSSVYGQNKKIPFSESDLTDHPVSLYGATKKANELLAASYHHMYDIPVTGLRFFTVYGPWGRPDMAYYAFTHAILSGQPISVFDEGKLKRDFTYIDDIVAGTAAAIDLEAGCEIFNLGNHKPVTVKKFIETLEHTLGVKAIQKFLPMQVGDVPETYADIEHSRKKLGFEPKVSLEEGLKHFVTWYKKQYAPLPSTPA